MGINWAGPEYPQEEWYIYLLMMILISWGSCAAFTAGVGVWLIVLVRVLQTTWDTSWWFRCGFSAVSRWSRTSSPASDVLLVQLLVEAVAAAAAEAWASPPSETVMAVACWVPSVTDDRPADFPTNDVKIFSIWDLNEDIRSSLLLPIVLRKEDSMSLMDSLRASAVTKV